MKTIFGALLLFMSSCCGPQQNIPKYADASISDYAIQLSFIGKVGDKYYRIFASGFAIDKDHILTAGHFCEEIASEKYIEDKLFFETTRTKERKSFDKIMIRYSKLIDFCVIKSENHKIKFLKVRNTPLRSGDKISSASGMEGFFPIRKYGEVLTFNTDFKNKRHTEKDYFLSSLKVIEGSSGGLIIDANAEIVGMVTAYIKLAPHISIILRIESICEKIKEVGIDCGKQ